MYGLQRYRVVHHNGESRVVRMECVLYRALVSYMQYLILNGSSFIISNKGQKVNLDDLKTGIPSVLNMKEMLALSDKNPEATCC